MRRTTIVLPEELIERLHRVAAERGVSTSHLIREAIEEKLSLHRPKPRSLGIGASGHPDTARQAGDVRPEPRSWR
jgi:metal-responsive CopG/Arc/MetJ family transcriptional regulator